MRFTVEYLGVCDAQNHIQLRLTFPGHGDRTRDILIEKDEIVGATPDPSEMAEQVIHRIRSFVREATWSTMPELRTALEAQEFDI